MLVAGAGLAGLAAAHDLMLDGADVTVVDARNRVGGRVSTVRVPSPTASMPKPAAISSTRASSEIRLARRGTGSEARSRILRGGFGYVTSRSIRSGARRRTADSGAGGTGLRNPSRV